MGSPDDVAGPGSAVDAGLADLPASPRLDTAAAVDASTLLDGAAPPTSDGPGSGGPDTARPADAPFDAGTDVGSDTAASDALVFGTGRFGTPQVIPALANPDQDDDPALSGDGLELYFASYRAGGLGFEDIWVSRRASTSDAWGAPTRPPALSSTGRDKAPALSADGLRIWLASDRPGGAGADDIWTATRTCRTAACPWSTPVPALGINSPSGEGTPMVFAGGLRMALRQQGSGIDLYLSKRAGVTDAWGTPTAIVEINTNANESGPHVSVDGLRLYFDSNRSGNDEIFVSVWDAQQGRFGSPTALSELNSIFTDADISLTDDERIVVFSSTRSGNAEIYEARR